MKENMEQLTKRKGVISNTLIMVCFVAGLFQSCSVSSEKGQEDYSWLIGDWVADFSYTVGSGDYEIIRKIFLFVNEDNLSMTDGVMYMIEDYEHLKHTSGRLRYNIENDTLAVRTYTNAADSGWTVHNVYFQMDPAAHLLRGYYHYYYEHEDSILVTYRKVEPADLEEWKNIRDAYVARVYGKLEVDWDPEFIVDIDDSYIYGLQDGVWKYSENGRNLLFDFAGNWGNTDGVKMIILDNDGMPENEYQGMWSPGTEDGVQAVLSFEGKDTLRLVYDLEHYGMIFEGQQLTYLVKPATGEPYPNKDIDASRFSQFINGFYNRFLNLRSDGTFTLDAFDKTDGNEWSLKPEFLSFLTERCRLSLESEKERIISYYMEENPYPYLEIDYAGLWIRTDKLMSVIPKDIVYLGSKGRYNFKVLMDYQNVYGEAVPHGVIFRIVEDDGKLLIDEVTLAY